MFADVCLFVCSPKHTRVVSTLSTCTQNAFSESGLQKSFLSLVTSPTLVEKVFADNDSMLPERTPVTVI